MVAVEEVCSDLSLVSKINGSGSWKKQNLDLHEQAGITIFHGACDY
jgi:hypothetical protein